MSDHPKFEAFKAERLKNPEIKAAYDEAVARNDLAAILDAHEFIPAYHGALSGRCKACHPPELDNMMGANVHRAHVAQMVLESDWLRGELDKAWCNGYHAGDCGEPDNPYRDNTTDRT